MMAPDRIAVIAGAAVAVVLQVLLAPYIAVGYAVPNFVAAYALVVAVSRPQSFGAPLPFVLGLLYDLVTGGPVGAMAFALTAISYLVARLFTSFDNDTLFMPIAVLAAGSLLVELVYGILIAMLGYNANLLEMLWYRILPCFVYDVVVGAAIFLLAARFFRQSGNTHHDIVQLR